MRNSIALAVAAAALIAAGCGGGSDPLPPLADPTTPDPAPSTSVPESPATSPPSPEATTAEADVGTTLGSTSAAARDVLVRGDVGDSVTELQNGLVRHGFEIDVDGHFGAATEAAVRGFQYSHGLEADGIAGSATWSTLDTADASSTVILRDDGLGIAALGDSAALVMPTLLEVLGTPEWDLTDRTTFACEQGLCERGQRTVRWSSPDGAVFSVRFEETDGVFDLVAWELTGWSGGRGVSLATSKGVALGSTASELLSVYPHADFGHYPEPACGDAWWNPGAFHIDVDEDNSTTGLRGSIDHDWDVMLDTLDSALIAHGIPEGLDCYQDVMCADVFGRFQELVGLPFGCGLNRSTWLELGLPLPPSPDAPVEVLRAGQIITEC